MEIIPFPHERALRIVLPGGSGQVGQMLARHFQERGHLVTVLTRGPYTAPWQTVHWDAEHRGAWIETLEGADVCINLAGRNVNCRYTPANRKAIYDSRIQSTQLLNQVLGELTDPPRLWLNASAATIYRRVLDGKNDLPVDETSAVVDGSEPETEGWSERRGFSSRVARDWEAAFFETETPRTRKVALRSAVTFSPTPGNVFAVLSNLVRLSLGGKQGNGRQFVTWIHETDYARAVEFIIAHEGLEGPINIAAPNPLPNREFMAGLRDAWNMPNGFPAPSLAIHLGALLMRTEAELVLQSCRAVPGRLLEAGFAFEFPEWAEAAEDLVMQWRNRE
ncbi:MAG: TIGR01777 family oxidoreductase [Terracidiphilus sp.]|nr:TIGR01777 family oxidoreductase [Terracidiphilus sp.]MDR3776855.1 TIGR01777 family oxidoreductase [Terracidiphilus sp.]